MTEFSHSQSWDDKRDLIVWLFAEIETVIAQECSFPN